MYLQAAAVEIHSALNACRHVAITLGANTDVVKETQNTFQADPLCALLDPAKTPRAEGREGRPRHGSGLEIAFGS